MAASRGGIAVFRLSKTSFCVPNVGLKQPSRAYNYNQFLRRHAKKPRKKREAVWDGYKPSGYEQFWNDRFSAQESNLTLLPSSNALAIPNVSPAVGFVAQEKVKLRKSEKGLAIVAILSVVVGAISLKYGLSTAASSIENETL